MIILDILVALAKLVVKALETPELYRMSLKMFASLILDVHWN